MSPEPEFCLNREIGNHPEGSAPYDCRDCRMHMIRNHPVLTPHQIRTGMKRAPIWYCKCGWEGGPGEIQTNDSGQKRCPKCEKSTHLQLEWRDVKEA